MASNYDHVLQSYAGLACRRAGAAGDSSSDGKTKAVTERIDEAPPRRFRPYPEYMDSGVDWLGKIPASWEVQPLKHLATFSTGWTPPTGREDLYGGEHLWANISDLGPMVLYKTEKTISDAAIREVRLRIVDAGSLLFSFKLSVGRVSIAGVNMYTNEAIAAFSPSSLIDTGYLFWAAPVLIPRNAQDNIYGAPLLNGERIANAKLLRPIPSEQHAIAAFLDRETAKVDALVARNERLIGLLQEKRTALITSAVTRGLDPNVPMKDSGVEWLGEVPAHWEVKRVNQTANVLRGKFTHRPRNDPSLYDGRYPFIQTGDVARAQKVITDYRQTLNERGLAVSKMFPAGTLVMTIAANIGDVAVLDFAACFPDSIVGFVPWDGVHRDYLYYVFLAMKPELLREAPVNTQGNLNVERIGSQETQIPLPVTAEQFAIVEFLDRETTRIDALIAKVREAIDHLREFRNALIFATVTGKIDVRATSAEATAGQGETP